MVRSRALSCSAVTIKSTLIAQFIGSSKKCLFVPLSQCVQFSDGITLFYLDDVRDQSRSALLRDSRMFAPWLETAGILWPEGLLWVPLSLGGFLACLNCVRAGSCSAFWSWFRFSCRFAVPGVPSAPGLMAHWHFLPERPSVRCRDRAQNNYLLARALAEPFASQV